MKCAKPLYALALAMHIKDINKTNKKQNIDIDWILSWGILS